MLKVKDLVKYFDDLAAVDAVSFEVKAGEIFSIIGPNGSGKTTIIKIIAGLIKPTEGTVEIDGYSIIENPVAAKSRIGYIPDDPIIWPGMTGEEFLHFTGALFGMKSALRQKEISELLKIFNLKGIEKKNFSDYSRGNKQKFAILAALLHQPKLLLIDEPIVGLDPLSAKIAQEQIKAQAEKGSAVLMATHTLNVAQKISSRIGVLNKGRLTNIGSMDELRKKAGLPESASLSDIYYSLTKDNSAPLADK